MSCQEPSETTAHAQANRGLEKDARSMPSENNCCRTSDGPDPACDELAGKLDDGACHKVLIEVSRANKLGVTITIWDLPQVTGLPLHEAFAAVRMLEFRRLLSIEDDPSDPFGAMLNVENAAAKPLRKLREV